VIEVVCGVLLDDDGKVLACRRSLDRHLGGLWEFPGGKVEAGEAPESALARELLEELGIVVGVGKRLDATVEWTDGAVTIRLAGFRCVIRSGEIEALEHDEIRWCTLDELSGLAWAEADVPLVVEISNLKILNSK
jgi:8-oxo-dGTP diphosphatase